ncbi:hypothetical protein FOZ62_017760, partial [Perkinsus olseni]
TQIWQLISMGEGGSDSFREFAVVRPDLMEERSSDGRGALFWAWEFGNTRVVRYQNGVSSSSPLSINRAIVIISLFLSPTV